MPDPVDRDSRGVLHPGAGLERFRLDRYAPAPAVARFIDRYWIVSWDLPPAVTHTQQVRWAELAAELGYADQAHLTRDFTAAVGMPPAAYARAATR